MSLHRPPTPRIVIQQLAEALAVTLGQPVHVGSRPAMGGTYLYTRTNGMLQGYTIALARQIVAAR